MLLVRERSAALYADALRQGAVGVVDLGGAVEEIVDVVAAAARGWALPASIASQLAAEGSASAQPAPG